MWMSNGPVGVLYDTMVVIESYCLDCGIKNVSGFCVWLVLVKGGWFLVFELSFVVLHLRVGGMEDGLVA